MTTNLNHTNIISWPETECFWLCKEMAEDHVLLLDIKEDGSAIEAYYCFLTNEQFCINSNHNISTAKLREILSDKLLAQPAQGPDAVTWWSNLFSMKDGRVEIHEYAGDLLAAEDTTMTMGKLISDLREEVCGWSLQTSGHVFVYGRYGHYFPLLYAIQEVINSPTSGRAKTNKSITKEQIQGKYWLPDEVLSKTVRISEGKLQINDLLNRHIPVIVPMEDNSLDSHIIEGGSWRNFIDNETKPDFQMGDINVKRIIISVYADGWKHAFISAPGCNTISISQDGKVNFLSSSEPVAEQKKEPALPNREHQPTLENPKL